jgi:hypothetical protein
VTGMLPGRPVFVSAHPRSVHRVDFPLPTVQQAQEWCRRLDSYPPLACTVSK